MDSTYSDILGNIKVQSNLQVARELYFVGTRNVLARIGQRLRFLVGYRMNEFLFHGYVVPPGEIVVVMFGFEYEDAGGIPNIFLQGEKIEPHMFRNDVAYQVAVLSEYPGYVTINGEDELVAISEGEKIRLSLSVPIRVSLQNLVPLLGKFLKLEISPNQFNRNVNEWVVSIVKDIVANYTYLWTGDRDAILSELMRQLGERLPKGLAVDVDGISFIRQYPERLYEIALEFMVAEHSIQDFFDVQKGGDLYDFFHKVANRRNIRTDRDGAAFFTALAEASSQEKKMVAKWLDGLGLSVAASFVNQLYGDSGHLERERKLSEQMVLHAIRNPWLTWGERLTDAATSPISRLRALERKVEQVLASRK